MPDLLELTGVEFGIQALFVPMTGQPYLSRMGSFRISAAVDAPPPQPRWSSRSGRGAIAAATPEAPAAQAAHQ